MTPEKAQELAAQLGLDKPPAPRYENMPENNRPLNLGRLVNFRKAGMLVDRILTAAFWPFIPDECVVDNAMDALSYSEGNCFCAMVRTDVPPPVNQKITNATKIPRTMEKRSYLIWLGVILKEHWTALHPRSMAPPLVFSTRGDKKVPGAKPALGLMMKFDLRPPDGSTLEDIVANYGAILPGDTIVKPEHVFLPDVTPEPAGVESSPEAPKT